ncbi:PIGA, GPI anchor biosynthesis [Kalmanozyma brasiliensis GHG001]|uniref:phosphatidylinositol N-acetylglucosaminyltransferase n=1 Tax=Kalmanozyma brasiliensis (strain GHG001) TaxID=1365824 RepID=V5ET43_KALBG|nr:PIGA, GPI anchor biosynthesis [Kalmanozyma brasiliensis GHG001]EST08420.1 PIGA, GPI anchor biosynthesis [Kalmanozyma brasiliensis GHG001]
MVKAKTDPGAPEAVLQLLAHIEAVQLAEQSDASSSSNTLPPLHLDRPLSLLQQCLDLTLESPDELSASFKYGLDALRLWASHMASQLSSPSASSYETNTKQRLLPQEHQLSLADVIWSACHSERTQVSSRSKAVFEAVIALFAAIHGSPSKDSQRPPKTPLPYPQDSSFLSTLVERSLSQLERKQSPIVLEVIMAKYGSAPFLVTAPGGSTLADSDIYDRMIRGLGTVDGGANRRSRLALSFLAARAEDLKCQLWPTPKADAVDSSDSTSWQAWVGIWKQALASALKNGGERLRSGLASYHLASLFDLDRRIFPTLLDSLIAGSTTHDEINVESVFLVLRIAKVQGLCRIDTAPDFATEQRSDGQPAQVVVPAVLLKDCILAAASELQISALSLVIESKTPAASLTSAEFDVLRTFFPYSLTITNAAARGELRGFFVKLLTRLRASTYALARDMAKITRIDEAERYPQEKEKLAAMQASLDASRSFLEWMVQLIRATLHPGASYSASITALTFLDLILESGVDSSFTHNGQQKAGDNALSKNAGMSLNKSKQVFLQEFPFSIDIITPSLVKLLLACSEISYDDVQARALTMLARCPAPLAGLEAADVAAQRILGRAAELLTSTRDFECAAASKLIQLYRQIHMQQLGHRPAPLLTLVGGQQDAPSRPCAHPTLSLIFDLFDFLDFHIRVAEDAKILEAANSHPLHGTLVTLQELFASISIHSLAPADRSSFREAVLRAQELIDRVWQVTKAVLCNSAPEGSTEAETTDGTANGANVGLDQPASHETALAMQVADDDGKAALMQPQEESMAGPKHQVILSYSWRGMKEASALLGVLVAVTLASPPSLRGKKGAETASMPQGSEIWREIYSVQDIEAVGQRFSMWLTQVRHRGAFSTIYPAYCNAASAIVRSQAADIADLPQQWITAFLDTVALSGSQLSITRRSAGIGYAVLALVSAQPNKADPSVLRSTVSRLMQIATQDSAQSVTMPVASIHALNILRVLVMDGGLTDHMSPYLGSLLELTISKFRSRFWGLRNVSMMLFSSLSIKIFGSRNTNKDTKDARMPIDEFFAAYPNLDVFLRGVLGETGTADAGMDEGAESSLFAVVMLLSRMQAPEDEPKRKDDAERMQVYRTLLSACLANKVWKVREVTAKAYAAFVPLRTAAQHAAAILDTVELRSQNELHGKLMLVQRLLKSVADAEAPTTALANDMAALSETLMGNASKLLERNRCAITQAAFLEVIQTLVGLREAAFLDTASHLLRVVAVWISMLMADIERSAVLEKLVRSPGGPALLGVSVRLQLQVAAGGSANESFLDCCTRFVASESSDVRIACLEALIGNDGTDALQESCRRQPDRVATFVRKLHAAAQDEGEGIWHRVHFAEILHQLAIRNDADGASWLQSAFSNGDLVSEAAFVARLVKSTVCVPLREALLPYLSDLCKLLMHSATQAAGSEAVLQQWSWAVTRCADEYASVQSREAAVESLRVLGSILFPAAQVKLSQTQFHRATSSALFKARIAAIDLLTDDDEEVRAEAAALIGETISAGSNASPRAQLTQCEAMQQMARRGGASPDVSTDRAWAWMAAFYASDDDDAFWERHVFTQLFPSSKSMDKLFEEALASSTLLFAEEKPNQFRDPEATLRRAARFVDLVSLEPEERARYQQRTAKDLGRLAQALADGAGYDTVATHVLAMRLLLANHALSEAIGTSSAEAQEAVQSIVSSLGIDLSSIESLDTFQKTASEGQEEAVASADASAQPRYNIAMVSDFFYPNVGGVEGHIYFLGGRLLSLGHKVIVITHSYAPDRTGIRYLSNGLKVYHVPYHVIARQDTLPNFFAFFPALRSILLRENIQIVHGHQALSSMAHEGILHARTMGLRTIFTDHSLFGFSDTASILTNKLLRFALADVDGVVCVSHTGKENTVLRANLDPRKVSVVPNAVVAEHFLPEEGTVERGGRLTVVVLSRLMYRKGIDLLIAAIPRLCATHPELHFLIGGDGPKRVELEQMRERYLLQDRVELCGAVRQGDVRTHLTKGSIFLNTSLTEAFGTGIIEAACCGLFVVSTRVGGVPEVLPPEMVRLAKPEEDDVVQKMDEAIAYVRAGKHDAKAYHEAVKRMYSWTDVAKRVERVYEDAMQGKFPSKSERLRRYYGGGVVAGKIFVIIVVVDMLFLMVLEWWLPEGRVDRCPAFRPRHLGMGSGERAGKEEMVVGVQLPEDEARDLEQLLS